MHTPLIQEFQSSHAQLIKITNELENLIESMDKTSSIIARAAKLWSELKTWKKIVCGFALSIPTLLIGIFAHVPIITTISLFMVSLYTISGFLLSNHQNNHASQAARFRLGIDTMVDLVCVFIKQLDNLSSELTTELTRLKQENTLHSQNKNGLNLQKQELNQQIEELSAANTFLLSTQAELNQIIVELKESNSNLSTLQARTQEEYINAKTEFQKVNSDLSLKVDELTQAKDVVEAEHINMKAVQLSIKDVVFNLCDIVFKDGLRAEENLRKLNEFLSNKQQSFAEFAAGFSQSSKDLAAAQEKVQHEAKSQAVLLNLYNKLLISQEQSKERMNQLALTKFGIFAKAETDYEALELECDFTIL